jgi:Carboxypeptidase regulatory-like domain
MIHLRKCILAGMALMAAVLQLSAQEARGRISGRVQDPSGAPIPHAAVEAKEESTQVKVAATTNESGTYELLYLIPGTYTLSVSAAGFQPYERTNVEVRVEDRLTLDINLGIGPITQSVVVSGQVAVVDTASANLGQVTEKRSFIDMPLPGGNSLQLAQLAPGVLYLAQPNHPTLGVGAVEIVSNLSVDGTRAGNVEFSVDGSPSMGAVNGTPTVSFSPPTEMVAEVKVQTATYDASTARVPGGNVNIVLRSGANEFHGSAQWFHTDQHLEGLTLFSRQFLYNPATGPVTDAKALQVNPLNILNRYSATGSGPVRLPRLYDGRNRTFWSLGFEGLTRPVETLGSPTTVPIDAERTGDFSSLLKVGSNYQIYDPATTAAASGGHYSRQPFPGNVIPASRLDKTAMNLLKYWPEPNTPGNSDGVNNYTPLSTQANHQKNVVAKVDQHFNERHSLSARYNYASQLYIADTLAPSKTTVPDRWRFSNGAAFDDVYVISPSLLTNFRLGFTRFEQSNTPEMAGLDLASLGFSPALNAAIDPTARQFPNLSVSGYQGLGGATNNDAVTNYLTTSNDVSWSKGAAVLRFGGEFRLYRSNSWALSGEDPSLTFNQKYTNGPLDSSAASPIGQGLASFLLGVPSSGSVSLNDSYADQSYNYVLYFQSDWRLTKTLTVNAGLRYDYEGPVTERFNRSVGAFNFGVASPLAAQAIANYAQNPIRQIAASQFRVNGGLTFAGLNGVPRELWDNSHLDFAPRVGLAWEPLSNTVIRAGYGIFYVPLGVDRNAVNQTGFTTSTTLNPTLDNGLTFVASLANPFPNGLAAPLGAKGGLLTGLGQAVSFFPPTMRSAYMQRFSLGLQRHLPKRISLDVTYAGTHGAHLAASRQYDAVPAAYLSTSPFRDQTTINALTAQVANPFYPLLPATNLASTTVAVSQLLRPYPQLTGITANDPCGYSLYDGLQVLSERRFANGFTLQFNWTWSKFIDGTSFRNDSDPLPERVISDLDRTHVVHTSGIYELPLGRGKRFFSAAHGITRVLADGWQLEGGMQYNSGQALGFGDALLIAPIQDVALPSGQQTIAQWFNVAAFDRKSADQLANNLVTLSTRLSGVRGPSVEIWNLSGLKNFFLTEEWKLQFRSEFLNAFNHTVLANPNTSPTSSAFGSITAASSQPRFIHFGLKLSF